MGAPTPLHGDLRTLSSLAVLFRLYFEHFSYLIKVLTLWWSSLAYWSWRAEMENILGMPGPWVFIPQNFSPFLAPFNRWLGSSCCSYYRWMDGHKCQYSPTFQMTFADYTQRNGNFYSLFVTTVLNFCCALTLQARDFAVVPYNIFCLEDIFGGKMAPPGFVWNLLFQKKRTVHIDHHWR